MELYKDRRNYTKIKQIIKRQEFYTETERILQR